MKKIDFKGFRSRVFSRIRFGLIAGVLVGLSGPLFGAEAFAADIALDGNWISTGVSPVSGNISGYGYYQNLDPYGMPGLTVVLYVESAHAPVFAGNGITFAIPAVDPGTKMTFSFLGTGGLPADARLTTTLNDFRPEGLFCLTSSGAVSGSIVMKINGSYTCYNTSDFDAFVKIAGISVTVGPPDFSELLTQLGLVLSVDGTTILGPNGEVLAYGSSPFNTFANFCLECGHPVNMVNGTLWHKLTDFLVRGRTPETKLELTRTYLSKPVFSGGDFGPHWFHNWESRILALNGNENPNLVWIDEAGGPWIFRRRLDGSYINPPGFFGSLTETSSEYVLDRTHGTSFHFSKNVTVAPYGRLSSIVERHGEKISFQYDENGKLSEVSSPFAGSVTFSRNSAGYIDGVRRVRDSLDYTYRYDSLNRLVQSSDFDGNSTSYTYVANSYDRTNGLLQGITDPLGRTLSTDYDPATGKVVAQTEPGNARRTFVYSGTAAAPMNIIFEIDGSAAVFNFGSRYLLTDVASNLGKTEHYIWSENNQLLSYTDPLGYTTRYGYDARGNLSSVMKPLDTRPTLMTYDPVFDRMKSVTPLSGTPSTFEVSQSNGDVLGIRRLGSGKTLSEEIGYDSFGNARSFSNGLGTFANQTDSNGLLSSVFDKRNPETRSYDSRGRIAKRVFASGRVLSYEWDDFDRVTAISDSSGPATRLSYDVVGRVTSRTLSDGQHDQTTTYVWDARDRLVSETDPLGNVTQYEYDLRQVLSKPIVKTDPNGHRTLYSYDLLGRLSTETDANGGVTVYGYNERGDRTTVTDAAGKTTRFSFDGNGRLVSRSRPSLVSDASGTREYFEVSNFFYDASGKLIREEKPSAAGGKAVIEIAYDDFDRVVRRTLSRVDAKGKVTNEENAIFEYANELDRNLLVKASNEVAILEFSYDPAPPYLPTSYSVRAADSRNSLGLIEGKYRINRDVSNGVESIVDEKGKTLFNAKFDAASRLLELASGNRVGPSKGLSFKISYDGFGRKSEIDASSGEREEISYDDLNRTKDLAWSKSNSFKKVFGFFGHRIGNPVVNESIDYDPAGNITGIAREFGSFEYGYDSRNQLTSVIARGGRHHEDRNLSRQFDQTFRYDSVGNRVFASIDGGDAQFLNNQIVQNSKGDFSSDADGFGALAMIRESHGRAIKRFAYRADGKLSAFTLEGDCDRSDDDGFVIRKAEYFYDALGRRVAKRITAGDGVERRFGKRERALVHRYSHLANEDKILLARSSSNEELLYLDGQGIDEHLGQVSKRSSRVYLTDHLGSVLNSALTDEYRAYGAFGMGFDSRNWFGLRISEEPVVYGFSGRQYDAESETYYFRARTYIQSEGRFLQKDPIGLEGRDLNIYRYVRNNPINATDPYGLCDFSDVRRILQGVSGFGYATIILGIFQDNAGNIGGKPLNQNEEYQLAIAQAQLALQRANITLPSSSFYPPDLHPVDPNADLPQFIPAPPQY